MMKIMKNKCFFTYLSAILAISSVVSGAVWTGQGDGVSWSNQNNWDTQVTPDKNTEVTIDGNAYVNFDSGNFERSTDTNVGGNAQLILANRRFLHANSAPATMTISDNAVVTQSGNYFIVGQEHLGTINQTGGTLTSTIDRGFFMSDRVGGAGSIYNLTGGELNVNYYDSTTEWHYEVLGRAGANATILVDGGEAHFNVMSPGNRGLYILSGGDSIFQVDSGLAEFTGFKNFVVGHQGQNSITTGLASVIITGGEMLIENVESGAVIVGGSNGEGIFKVSGGFLTINGGSGLSIGYHQKGIFEQTGGIISITGDITLGLQDTSENADDTGSYYLMDGGSLTVNDITLSENADSSVKFMFNSGQITLAGDRVSILNESWFEAGTGVLATYDEESDTTTLSILPYAHTPSPSIGQANVGDNITGTTADVALSWKTGWDPQNPGQPNSDIIKHHLYMSDGSDNDPNLYFVDEIDAGNPVLESAGYDRTLDLDKHYSWRVDEETSSEIITGKVWYFDTPKTIPIITTQPEGLYVYPNETAEFSVVVDSVSSVDYTWYKSLDAEATPSTDVQVGSGSSQLQLASVQIADEGYYYCEVTNGGGTAYTDVVTLGVARKVAHWTLDEADYSDGLYLDISGSDIHADPNGTPVFSDGIVNGDKDATAVASGAVTINEDTGWADAGSFYPAEFTNEFSISAWLNQTGVDEIANGMIVCKRSAWNAAQSDWIFMVTSNGQLRFQSADHSTLNASVGLIQKNTWQHVAVAFVDETATMYIDGVEVAQGEFIPSGGHDSTFWIGRNESLGERFDGALDDIQVYNYALTAEQVIDVYYAETGKAICLYELQSDINNDCSIDMDDLAEIAENWLDSGYYPMR